MACTRSDPADTFWSRTGKLGTRMADGAPTAEEEERRHGSGDPTGATRWAAVRIGLEPSADACCLEHARSGAWVRACAERQRAERAAGPACPCCGSRHGGIGCPVDERR